MFPRTKRDAYLGRAREAGKRLGMGLRDMTDHDIGSAGGDFLELAVVVAPIVDS